MKFVSGIGAAAMLAVPVATNPLAGQVAEAEAPQVTETVETVEVATKPLTIEQQVREYFADVPSLANVAYCESRFRQYDANGNILRGRVNGRDVGVFQINEYYHLQTALKKGIDLYTLEGNMEYARYLYETQGLQPWSASRPCWG